MQGEKQRKYNKEKKGEMNVIAEVVNLRNHQKGLNTSRKKEVRKEGEEKRNKTKRKQGNGIIEPMETENF